MLFLGEKMGNQRRREQNGFGSFRGDDQAPQSDWDLKRRILLFDPVPPPNGLSCARKSFDKGLIASCDVLCKHCFDDLCGVFASVIGWDF